MQQTGFHDHTRHNMGVLARVEKRLLVAIAARLPAAVTSDHLTALGFAGMLLAAVSFWVASEHPAALLGALAGLALNWFGDSLDGTLARVRDRLRPRYGYYLDHVLDVIGVAALIAGFALSGYMTPLVAASFGLVYLLFSAELFLATYTLGVFRMSWWRFGPTELRLVLAVGIARILVSPWVTVGDHRLLLFDVGGVAGAVGLAVALVVAIVRNARALALAEPA